MMTPYVFAILNDVGRRKFNDQNIVVASSRNLPQYIKERVCEFFRITVAEIESDSMKRIHAHPRHVAMWLLRKHTSFSLIEIGDLFNRGRDGAKASIDKAADLIETEEAFRKNVEKLNRSIFGRTDLTNTNIRTSTSLRNTTKR